MTKVTSAGQSENFSVFCFFLTTGGRNSVGLGMKTKWAWISYVLLDREKFVHKKRYGKWHSPYITYTGKMCLAEGQSRLHQLQMLLWCLPVEQFYAKPLDISELWTVHVWNDGNKNQLVGLLPWSFLREFHSQLNFNYTVSEVILGSQIHPFRK